MTEEARCLGLMKEFTDLKNPSKYNQEWKAFGLFANQRIPGAPPCGWCALDECGIPLPGALPDIDNSTVLKYGAWLLEATNKYKKANLSNSRAAVNHFYIKAKRAPPWQGPAFFRSMGAYMGARLKQAIKDGDKKAGGLRVAITEDVCEWILEQAEEQQDGCDKQTKLTLILLGWVFCLRAGSTSFVEGDIKFAKNEDGTPRYLIVDSDCLKLEDPNPSQYKQRRCPAPDPKLGPMHPRARFMALVEIMITKGNVAISGAPTKTSDIMTKWIRELIPDDIAHLPKGHSLSSHSLRKGCASALNGCGCDIRIVIMPWGRWMSYTSCQGYITKGYQSTRFSNGMFDWIAPRGTSIDWAGTQ